MLFSIIDDSKNVFLLIHGLFDTVFHLYNDTDFESEDAHAHFDFDFIANGNRLFNNLADYEIITLCAIKLTKAFLHTVIQIYR